MNFCDIWGKICLDTIKVDFWNVSASDRLCVTTPAVSKVFF